MPKAALITLHGMGKIKPSYYLDLEEGLKKQLGIKWTELSFQNVQYAPILQGPEDTLWSDMNACVENDLDGVKLRQFFLYGFGDAGSLEHSLKTDKNVYIRTQVEIFKALQKALDDFSGNESSPVVVIAHSLGCQVICNYIWDAQHSLNLFAPENTYYASGATIKGFHKLESCRNLITTGCNIPLFIAGLPVRECFTKPHPEFKWDNYYDSDDVLG
jgi:hypothetical protein